LREDETLRVTETEAFRRLVRQKRAFLSACFAFMFLFFLPLPILTAFTTVLNGAVVGTLNWAHVYSFAQFAVAGAVALLYWRAARHFDELARRAREEAFESRGVSP
jgi:uncharacterized membrane protein (DUF485 family)